jgi:excisionase family DNA binding protein
MKDDPFFKPLLSTAQIARKIRRPESTIRAWTRHKIIPHIMIGRRTRFYVEEDVRKALMRRTVREVV